MYSDDSAAASEIVSDDEELRAGGAESDVASEVDESGGKQPPAKPSVVSGAYEDDAYEDEDEDEDENENDGYSVDFEDDASPSPRASSPTRRPTATITATAIDDDEEYGEASFEADESRRSASASASARHVVDLSVPSATRSPSRASSKPPSPFPNSPHVDLKVLSKPAAAPPPPLAQQQQQVGAPTHSPRPYWFTTPPLPLADGGEEKKFSLLLRKVESKFEDEVEALREKNTLLQWKERELKAELRMHRDELKMRKTRMDKKRRRALERRREHERLLERLRAELRDAAVKHEAAEAQGLSYEAEKKRLSEALASVESERRAVDERNRALTEQLQATLSDFHALNLRFEDAVNARLVAEKRADDSAGQHRVEVQVLEHKYLLEVDAAQRALAAEVAAREAERTTLPESHRAVLAVERERFEQREAALMQQMRELETQASHDVLRLESVATRALEQQRHAEEKAEKRVQTELQAVRLCGPAFQLAVAIRYCNMATFLTIWAVLGYILLALSVYGTLPGRSLASVTQWTSNGASCSCLSHARPHGRTRSVDGSTPCGSSWTSAP